MPVIGVASGKSGFSGAKLEFGKLWTLIGETADRVTFYYRNSSDTSSKYFPQVIVGTPEANLNRYLKNARKIQL